MSKSVQVKKEHYYEGYDDLFRYISYSYQVSEAVKLRPSSILEIGIGNGTVTDALRKYGFSVTTCDFDGALNPDVVADIRDLSSFGDNSYDLVMACEVLEHIPWSDVPKVLGELRRISKGNVIVSIPQYGFAINLNISLPFIDRVFKRKSFDFGFFIHRFYSNPSFDGQHYWEVGGKDFSVRRVRGEICKYFDIKNEFEIPLNRFHRFYILSKKL